MSTVRKSLAFSFAEKYSVMVLQFISTIILARLLTPEDIGIFSVAAVIIGLAHMLRDFGVANYLVQEKDLTPDRIKTALGVTLTIAWSTALVLFLASSNIANFYDEPGVKNVTLILACSFLFIPFSSTILGLLRREMSFRTLFFINIIAAVAHAITGISLAYLGYGYESLAWATIASAGTTVIVGIIKRPEGSQFKPSFKEFRRIFRFGSYSSAANFIQEAGTTTPDLAIGKLLGFSSLGIYSRAFGFVSIFNYAITAAITPVVIPAFAQAHRDGTQIKKHYLLATSYYTALAWPFFCFISIMALPLILLLYGNQWIAAAPIAQLLCFAFMLHTLSFFAGNYLVATGQIELYFKSQLILQIPRIILTIAAAFHSLAMVAAIQIIFYAASFILYHHYVHTKIEIELNGIISATYKSALIAIISSATTYLSTYITTPENNVTLVFIASLTFTITWLLAIFGLKHDLRHEITALKVKYLTPQPK